MMRQLVWQQTVAPALLTAHDFQDRNMLSADMTVRRLTMACQSDAKACLMIVDNDHCGIAAVRVP